MVHKQGSRQEMETDIHTSIVFYTVRCVPNSPFVCHLTYWLWRTVPIILLTIGTFGNLFTLAVISRRRMRKNTTTVFLGILACSDVGTLWFLMMRTLIWNFQNINISVSTKGTCAIYECMTFVFGGISSWLLVLLTFERVLYTSYPVLSKLKATTKNALKVSIFVLIVNCLFPIHLPFGLTVVEIPGQPNTTDLEPNMECLPRRWYAGFYNSAWNFIVMIFYNILPFLIISIGNCFVAFKLKKRNVIHPVLPTINSSTARQKSATKTLFVLSAFFIITTTPFCLFEVAESLLPEKTNPTAPHVPWIQFLRALTFFLLCCNFTFNFFLYFLVGSLFKREWIHLISDVKSKVFGRRDQQDVDIAMSQVASSSTSRPS